MARSQATNEAPASQNRLTRRQLTSAAAGCLALPILAACGPVAADTGTVIEMTNRRRFEPGGLTVPVGTTVVWRNASSTRHTATCDPELAEVLAHVVLPGGAAAWSSGDLYTGQAWHYTFMVPGTYLYFCRYHERDGMIGTIAVVG